MVRGAAGEGRADARPASVVSGQEAIILGAAEAMRADGWSVAPSWQLPAEPFDLSGQRCVCVGRIGVRDDIAAAVIAAQRGVVVLAHCPDPRVATALVDELNRITPTELRDSPVAAPVLTDDQRAILDLLAEGATMAQVASKLYLSMRTTERKLAAARAALGVKTTADALRIYRESR